METISKVNVTYRQIAVMLSKALPIEAEDFKTHVDILIETIRKLPIEARHALRAAYIFSSKVPREEREDMFQDLFLNVFKAQTSDMPLAYAIARCDWQDWYKSYYKRQELVCTFEYGSYRPTAVKPDCERGKCTACPYGVYRARVTSLNTTTTDFDGHNCEIGDLIAGETEFEAKQIGKLEASRIWKLLPKQIRPIVEKNLIGQPLRTSERRELSEYVKRHGHEILLRES